MRLQQLQYKKYTPILLLIIALALGGTFLMIQGNDAVSLAENEKGCILTADTVNVSFQGVGGRIISVETAEQNNVQKGDIIMRLDTTDIDLQIEQLESTIGQQNIKILQAAIQQVRPEELEKQKLTAASAQETLELAKNNYDRCTALYQEGGISRVQYENAVSQYEIAKNTVAQQKSQIENLAAQNSTTSQNYEYNEDLMALQKDTLETQLKALKLLRERMTLKAPVDGKITRLVPKIGENITSNATAAIIQSSSLYYSIYVDETQVSNFEKGKTISGRVPALKEEIKGTIRSIASAPQYANLRMSRDKGLSDTSSYIIIVDVKASPKLLPGMTVEVDINECNS